MAASYRYLLTEDGVTHSYDGAAVSDVEARREATTFLAEILRDRAGLTQADVSLTVQVLDPGGRQVCTVTATISR